MHIDIDNVVSVYSGLSNRCYCGCSGKHTYASKYRKYASKRRGYVVTNDEVNDKVVKRIVNYLNKNADRIETHPDGNIFTIQYSEVRDYTVYLR